MTSMCIHHMAQRAGHHLQTSRVRPENRGQASVGDSRVPGIGNGGYDAQHYDASLTVGKDGSLDARSVMTAVATQELDSLNLDFVGFEVEQVLVNGEQARFRREEAELVVEPGAPLKTGEEFSVEVKYEGQPTPFKSAHAPVPLGWNSFEGGSFVVSEPDGTRGWLPVNDHPTDKATYSFHINVPKPKVAAANGVLTAIEEDADSRTFHFEARDPMASYLATVHVGDYVTRESQAPDGTPIRNYFPADLVKEAEHDFGRVPEMMAFFGEKFGKYPFEVYGNIVMDTNLGGAAALETQTLPLYDRGIVDGRRGAEYVLVHELAHHWFGNSVSPSDWKDIWLNEGLASYCEALWAEHQGGPKALSRSLQRAEAAVRTYGAREPIGEPRPDGLFDTKVYKGGMLAVHALRRELGDEAFFQTLRTYAERHANASASTASLTAVASEVAGRDMKPFFDKWIYSEKLPPVPA
jgi:aminopeptidase N